MALSDPFLTEVDMHSVTSKMDAMLAFFSPGNAFYLMINLLNLLHKNDNFIPQTSKRLHQTS